jgi:putative toxin-antitoxin system antitoxin component (TIGR02293 family)
MAKSSKYTKGADAKSGQYLSSKKTQTVRYSPKSTAKFQEVGGSAERVVLKKSAMGANIAIEIQYSDIHRHSTSIIVEETDKPEWQMTAVEKMDMVRDGVSKKDLESLKSKTNLDYDKLSTLLSTNRATLINKKGTEHFSATLSERIVSIADLYSYGFEVFEDENKFNEWIFRPNQALGGKQPFELLDNQFGREEVKNVIGRIDYGVYS